MREEFPAEIAAELVHARYLGETTVVMPDLVGRERCCEEANHRTDDPEGKPNPHAVLEPGDVVLLDRWSVEGRSDFELVDVEPKLAGFFAGEGQALDEEELEGLSAKALGERAAELGVEGRSKMNKEQLAAAIAAAESAEQPAP